ncbi:phytosulfokines-like [Cornus florida]|uniref:phytosulfokines-like n=1 Tax=Cornus florida TaxID=4283 RepID=UPI00289A300D|nr:phytosulfokines-like [Cornus florida]
MSKVSTLCMIALLLFFTLTCSAARPEPALHHVPLMNTQHGVGESEKVELEEDCGGIGEEECLMRRTLAAHIDYIYTQKQKP